MCCSVLTCFVKCLLLAANLIFVLVGIWLVAIGVILLTDIIEILDLIPVRVDLYPIGFIVIGCIIFVIAFCGCCGSMVENRCLIVLYGVAMLLIVALNIAFSILVFIKLGELRNLIKQWLNNAFENQNLSEAFHVLESSFRCCGTTGAGAYGDRPLPLSCCYERNSILEIYPFTQLCTTENAFPDGCNSIFYDYLDKFIPYIAFGSLAAIVVEVVAMFSAFFLNARITNARNKPALLPPRVVHVY